LNVRYVLEGSVQRSGGRMRVNVQLIDTESGNHLWAERFDKTLADLFEMQDEIVARLAGALNMQLVTGEARRAEQAPNPDSMDLYFQGLACSACPHIVKGSLAAVPGVSEVLISFKDKTATVTYDDAKAAIPLLARATTEAGYPSAPKS
jgi:mercuric transport protein